MDWKDDLWQILIWEQNVLKNFGVPFELLRIVDSGSQRIPTSLFFHPLVFESEMHEQTLFEISA